MKSLVVIYIISLLACFEKKTRERNSSVSEKNNVSIYKTAEMSTPDSIVPPSILLPKGIILDTTIRFDSLIFLTTEIIQPRSSEKSMLSAQRLLRSIINKKKTKFVVSVHQRIKKYGQSDESLTGNRFRVWPEEIYKKDRVLSILFLIEVYYAGAPHPTMDYYSFNYDLRQQKLIYFNDYFSIHRRSDGDKLLKKINAYFNDPFVSVKKLSEFHFNFDEKNIYFDFGDYKIADYSYGTLRAQFSRKNLKPFISSCYQ